MADWGMVAAGALVGATDKYGEIQKEQRQFKMDEAKAQANMARQQNFARFKHSLEGSGMYSEQGQEYTREEFSALEEPKKESALNQFDMQEKARKAAKGDQLSQWVDKETGEVLTNEAAEARKGDPNLVTKNAYTLEQTVEREGRKEKAAEKKAAAKGIESAKKSFTKSLTTALDEVTNGNAAAAEPHQQIAAAMNAYQQIKLGEDTETMKAVIEENPALGQAIMISNDADEVLDMMRDNMPFSEVKQFLKDKGYNEKKSAVIFKLLQEQGKIEKSLTDKVIGFFGGGSTYSPVEEY